ncbi:uncharacterized protein [Chironomus tepperi]|uniref:uncharacterized protein n=1 Tax=Chironomus tepperi TaxID=113505 RepID=UPI00391F448A
MFAVTIVILSLCSAVLSDKCDNTKCPVVPKHYEELGCKPIYQQGYCCPLSFDCSSFTGRDISKCYHKGRAYEPMEKVEDSELESSCTVACRCTRYYPDEPAKITCAHIDCPEFFGSYEPRGRNCISQYEQDKCCKSRDVCDDDLKNLTTCNFHGKQYYEGEQMEPEQACYSCWCGRDFEDKPAHQNRYCKRINCNIDLHYSDRLHDGCVPIYYKTEDCCPIGTRCPDDDTTVIKTKNSKTAPDLPQCVFGDLKLSIGDNLSPEHGDQCKVCTCKTPPFVTCVQTC